jgi:hypothetical protein
MSKFDKNLMKFGRVDKLKSHVENLPSLEDEERLSAILKNTNIRQSKKNRLVQ